MSLTDFGAVDPPKLVRRQKVIWNGNMCGFWCQDTNRGFMAYASPRNRWEHEDQFQHYYQNEEGYGVSQGILDQFEERGIKRVYIVEQDRGDVIEYAPPQFFDGTEIEWEDPQKVVSVAEALNRWRDHASSVWHEDSRV